MSMRLRWGTTIVPLVVALWVAPPGQAKQCSPQLPETCSEAVVCGIAFDDFNEPHFQVEFLGRFYDASADETTFTYLLCRLQDAPNLSHWVIGLCDELQIAIVDSSGGDADSSIVDPDPTTCLDGFKFGTEGGIPLCDDTCQEGSSTGGVYTVTFAGNVPTGVIPAGVTIATKAGQLVDDICLEGPECTFGTTTTSTSSTTTSSTSTSTTSSTSSTSTSSSTSNTTTTTSSTSSTSTSSSTTTSMAVSTTIGETTTSTSTSTTTSSSTSSSTTTTSSSSTSTSSTPSSSSSTSTSSSSSTSTVPPTTSTSTSTTTSTTRPECVLPEDCADGDNCTEDICVEGRCSNPPLENPPPNETICNDMVDNDCDLLFDCDDPDCAGIAPCPPIKKDPTKIIFDARGDLDRMTSHGRVEPGEAIDVSQVEVGWMISKAGQPIYRAALIPGDFKANPKKTFFRFVDRGARDGRSKRFGIYRAKVRISRGGTSYGFRIDAFGDFSAADTPDMSIQFYIGDHIFIHDKPWRRTSYGWRAESFD